MVEGRLPGDVDDSTDACRQPPPVGRDPHAVLGEQGDGLLELGSGLETVQGRKVEGELCPRVLKIGVQHHHAPEQHDGLRDTFYAPCLAALLCLEIEVIGGDVGRIHAFRPRPFAL